MTAAPFAVQVDGIRISLERGEKRPIIVMNDTDGTIEFSLTSARAIAAAIRGLADVTSNGFNLPPFSTSTPDSRDEIPGGAAITPLSEHAGRPSAAGLRESSSPAAERGHTPRPGTPAEVAAALADRANGHRR